MGSKAARSAILVVAVGVTVGACQVRGTFAESPDPATPQQPVASVDPRRSIPDLVVVDSVLGYRELESAGTGIVLTSDGEVLTNNHVVEGATAIKVTDAGDGNTYNARVVGFDRSADVAVLRLDGAQHLPTARIGTRLPGIGERVYAVGNAGGKGLVVAPGSVTALNQSITASDDAAGSEQLSGLIEVAADVQPGDSGGPLLDTAGEVLGMDTAATTGFRFMRSAPQAGYAIPIATAAAIVERITSGQETDQVHIGATALLGVSVGTVAGQGGALVARVLPDSPADTAGVAVGDLITALDGRPVDAAFTLTAMMDRHHPGETVTLGWTDVDGVPHTARVTATSGPVG
jgi:S1-C subfamily serine protease